MSASGSVISPRRSLVSSWGGAQEARALSRQPSPARGQGPRWTPVRAALGLTLGLGSVLQA